MNVPPGWQNLITAKPGQLQADVDPLLLLPSRPDLSQLRLDMQQALVDAGLERSTPIEVTPDGVIWDGHHAVRIAAIAGKLVTIKVVNAQAKSSAGTIMDLKVS